MDELLERGESSVNMQEIEQEFIAFLTAKNIAAEPFRLSEPTDYRNWLEEFSKLSPEAFRMRKLFLINKIRLKYPLQQWR